MEKPIISIFRENPVKDTLKAILDANQSQIWRRFKNPKSGWFSFRVKRFPTSASEANNPQVVRRNGS